MCDFIIQLGSGATDEKVAAMLVNRPGVENVPVQHFHFSWGSLHVQLPHGRGYEPAAIDGTVYACAGRPRFKGVEHETRGKSGFAAVLAEQVTISQIEMTHKSMTGAYVCAMCSERGIRILTDMMGFRPAYLGSHPISEVRVLGTHLESVAALCGRATDVDLVSLGELLVHNYVSFPHTSRIGIYELAPASHITVDPSSPEVETCVLWEPCEPQEWPNHNELVETLSQSMKDAGRDIVLGVDRIAVTLSGGKDSRAVLCALPDRSVSAGVTYCTRPNRETDTAGRVAQALGIEHCLAMRSQEFYPQLMKRGMALLGTELRAQPHGFAISDNDLQERFDLFVGGQLSDTLLKDHFMPREERAKWTRVPRITKAKRQLKAAFKRKSAASESVESTLGRSQLELQLRTSVREAVRARRASRLGEVKRVRPTSAAEWVRFWPASRQDDSAHTLGNSRLCGFESLFTHTDIVRVAATIPAWEKVDGRLSNIVFNQFYGSIDEIPDANTGLQMSAGEKREAGRRRQFWKNPKMRQEFNRLSVSSHSWNDVQGSWADMALMQQRSPEWNALRECLQETWSLSVLDSVLKSESAELIANYDVQLGPTFNFMIVQLAHWLGGLANQNDELAGSVEQRELSQS